MDKLTDKLDVCEDECECSRGEAKEKCPIYKICYIGQVYDKLKDYEDLEEQGLLLRLPCKVGTPVYILRIFGQISGRFIYKIEEKPFDLDYFYDIRNGHNIFLTKEEAEAKLREMEE